MHRSNAVNDTGQRLSDLDQYCKVQGKIMHFLVNVSFGNRKRAPGALGRSPENERFKVPL